jgi:hypothetical protein
MLMHPNFHFLESMEERSSQAILYNVLLSGFRGNPLLLPALLQALTADGGESEPLAVIDVWALLSLAGTIEIIRQSVICWLSSLCVHRPRRAEQ